MSFSSKVKFETAAVMGLDRHCLVAELAAMVNHGCIITGTDGKFRILMHSENELAVLKFIKLVSSVFHYNCEKLFLGDELRETAVNDGNVSEKLLQATGILNDGHIGKRIYGPLTRLDCCKKAYIRGAFLCSGSISAPDNSYHLEFTCGSENLAKELEHLINSFGPSAKHILRKSSYIVYLKEADQISDVLNIIGSHAALLEYENSRVSKEMSNNINRIVNFSNANDSKIIEAAVKQTNDICYLMEKTGLDHLPPQLQRLAELRMENPELSLKELGEKLVPPLGKSGVNHRLRKINAMVEKLKEQKHCGSSE